MKILRVYLSLLGLIGFSACSQADTVFLSKKTQPIVDYFKDPVYATITEVNPNYRTMTVSRPQKVCREENVPLYGTVKGQGASGLDVLGGAIIGGLFGKAITDKDEGAAAGAVIGGVVAAEAGRADKREVVGYTQKTTCSTQYVDRVESFVDNYTIYYEWNGQYGSADVDKRYRIGDQVRVIINVTMLTSQ